MTIGKIIRHGTAILEEQQIPSARLDTELIVAFIMGRDRAWLLAHDDVELEEAQIEQFHNLLTRRLNREPLVHITGNREFYGLDIAITPDVLTPRVETEQMVEWAIKYAPQNTTLIDIGTGSGAIAIAIAKHRKDLRITATEVSAAALEVAQTNNATYQANINLVISDLWESVEGKYATIVTNLPYLRDEARAELMEEVKHEPDVALFGGEDGLDLYRKFLKDLPNYLLPNGYLFTECDPWQHESLVAEAAKYGLIPIEQGYFILGFKKSAAS
jgi:release factor glutamine methyltransferase